MVLTNALGQLSSVPLHLTTVARDECLPTFAALPFPLLSIQTEEKRLGLGTRLLLTVTTSIRCASVLETRYTEGMYTGVRQTRVA